MTRTSLLLLSLVALFTNACEQHPLPGEPPAHGEPAGGKGLHGTGEQHPGGAAPAPKEHRDDGGNPAQQTAPPGELKPADASKPPAEAPKFFPEKE